MLLKAVHERRIPQLGRDVKFGRFPNRGLPHCGRLHSLITNHENSVAFIAFRFQLRCFLTFLANLHQTLCLVYDL